MANTGNKLKSIHNSSKLLPEQVSAQITALIADRKLQVGEKLPNEFEMAEQLNVGRGTIREAVKILVSKNVVEIRRGCGTFVCDRPGVSDDPFGFAFVEDKKKLALDLCEFRLIVEPEIAALAALRATDDELEEINQVAQEVADLCQRQKRHMERDIAFHELIAKASKNNVMPNIIPVIQSGVALFINVTNSELTQETIRTHQLVVNALVERNPQKAREAMKEHLQGNWDKISQMTNI